MKTMEVNFNFKIFIYNFLRLGFKESYATIIFEKGRTYLQIKVKIFAKSIQCNSLFFHVEQNRHYVACRGENWRQKEYL